MYREENDQVILTMSRKDHENLIYFLGFAAGLTHRPPQDVFELLNRLNQGNPNYTPYQVTPDVRTR